MHVALLVEAHRLALQRVLGELEVELRRRGPSRLDRALERPVGGARVAPRPLREVVEGLVGDRRRIGDPALGVGERPVEQLAHMLRRERPQLVDLGAAEAGPS